MSNSNNISIAEPCVEHYEAFIDACKKMQAYINDDSIPNDVGKHESKGFIFARDDYVNMSREDFEKIIVNGYKEKSQEGSQKPEYFRFIMDGDTIVGSVNARALKRDRFDEANGLSTFEKWKGARVTGAEVVLPDYRGKGIFGKAQNLFFDEMRKHGINEITFTVLSNNDGSKKAHEKMMNKYGGRMYQVYGDSDGTGIKYYNRYVISTDTSGKSKDLYKLEKDFLSMPKESLPSYFSAQSSNPEFTNSQLYFNLFSKKYNLYEDGQFDRMCQDMKKSLGEDVYFQLMSNLHDLRDKKVEEIINNTGEFLTHTTNVPPEMMGGSVLPRNNLNQFGENRNNYVFATESESERDFYALRTVDKERKNINWKKQARVDGEEKNVFILEEINQESYTYFLPKEKFTPVVCLDGRFGHEWTATEEIPYSHHEKNNHEEIKKRNIVKLVDGTKFRGQNDTFREKLNNPDTIISTLDNSGVLKRDAIHSRIEDVRRMIGCTKAPFAPQEITVNPQVLSFYQAKRQNG